MKVAVVVFPGSNCDRDMAVALRAAGVEVSMVWHKEASLPERIDLAFLLAIIFVAARSRQNHRFVSQSSHMRSAVALFWACVMDFKCFQKPAFCQAR